MVRREFLKSGKVVKVVNRKDLLKTRQGKCKCCDEIVPAYTGYRADFPENSYLICDNCAEEGKPMKPINVKASKKPSNNCKEHRVVLNLADDNADRLWIESYGFKKMKDYHTQTYKNAQSIGSLANNLFKVDVVKVGLVGKGLVEVDNIDEYDEFTKAVCMRNYQ